MLAGAEGGRLRAGPGAVEVSGRTQRVGVGGVAEGGDPAEVQGQAGEAAGGAADDLNLLDQRKAHMICPHGFVRKQRVKCSASGGSVTHVLQRRSTIDRHLGTIQI